MITLLDRYGLCDRLCSIAVTASTWTAVMGIAWGSAPQTHELWVKLGQSNAVGTASTRPGFPGNALDLAGLDAPDSRVLEVARAGTAYPWAVPAGALTHLQRHKSHDTNYTSPTRKDDIGFQQSFGRVRVAGQPLITELAIFNGALGGSRLFNQWLPGDALFDAAVSEVSAFLAQAPHFELKGILWHQGESDAIAGRTQDEYEADLAYMVRELRTRIPGAGNAVFVAGTMSVTWRNATGTGAATVSRKQAVHAAHLRIPEYIPNSTVVILDDLREDLTGDFIHFGRHHLRIIGSRYAKAADTLLLNPPAPELPDYQFEYDSTSQSFQNTRGTEGAILAQSITTGPNPVLTTLPTGGFPTTLQVDLEHYTKALRVRLMAPPTNITSLMSHGNNALAQAHLMLCSRVGHGDYASCATNATFLDETNFPSAALPLGTDQTIQTPGPWVNLCVTYSGRQFRVFADGNELAHSPFTAYASPLAGVGGLDIGRWTSHGPTHMDGEIESVVVLPYAAHRREVGSLFN